MNNDNERLEFLIPTPVLTKRDPIILGKLSLREFFQWLVVSAIVYGIFNTFTGLDFSVRLVVGAAIAMLGGLFIHSPINGLAGLEWSYVMLRYLLEKKRHFTLPTQPTGQTHSRIRPMFKGSFGFGLEANANKALASSSDLEPNPIIGPELATVARTQEH